MPAPDAQIYPHATGKAADTVKRHSAPGADVVFWSGWFCPYVQRSWLALEFKGIPYTYKEVNPYLKEAEFLEISPRGLVPAIQYQGQALPESLIINEFLEDAFPDAKPLYPKDPFAKARVRLSIDIVSKEIIPHFFTLTQAQDEERRKESRASLTAGLNKWFDASLNGSIAKGGFWAGKDITLTDIALIPWFARFYIIENHRAFDASAVPHFKTYRQKVLSLPQVQNTISDSDKYEEIYQRYLKDEAQSEAAKAVRSGKPGFF